MGVKKFVDPVHYNGKVDHNKTSALSKPAAQTAPPGSLPHTNPPKSTPGKPECICQMKMVSQSTAVN